MNASHDASELRRTLSTKALDHHQSTAVDGKFTV